MADDFYWSHNTLSGPARKMYAITPHATNEVDPLPKAVLVTVAGNLACRAVDSTADLTIPVIAGQMLPVRIKYVRATGTTATVVGLS